MCIGKVSRRVSHTPYRPQKVAVPVPVPVLPYCATMQRFQMYGTRYTKLWRIYNGWINGLMD